MPAKRSTRKPRNCHSDRTGMRRGSCWLHAKPCVGYTIVSNKNVKRGAHRKDRATLRLFGPLLFVTCRLVPVRVIGGDDCRRLRRLRIEGPDQHIARPTYRRNRHPHRRPACPRQSPPTVLPCPSRQCDETDDARQSADRRGPAANRPLIIPPARPWKAFQRSPQAPLLPRRQAARPARWPAAAA